MWTTSLETEQKQDQVSKQLENSEILQTNQ